MKKTMFFAFAGALMAGCSINNNVFENGDSQFITDSVRWNAALEQEFRKMDSWIEDYVDFDYENKKKEGHVTLRLFPRERLEEHIKRGALEFHAAYNPHDDTLILPEGNPPKAISHEMFHAIYDSKKVEGLLHSPMYTGPSLDEIADYAEHKTSSSEFNALRKELRLWEEIQGLEGILKDFVYTFGRRYVKALEVYKETTKYTPDISKFNEFLTDEERETISSQQSHLREKLIKYREDFLKMDSWIEEWYSSIEGREEDVTLEEIRSGKKKLKEFGEELEAYVDLLAETSNFRNTVHETYEKAKDRYYENEIEEAKKEGNQRLVEDSQRLRDFSKIQSSISKMLKDFTGADLMGSMESMLRRLTYRDNEYKIDQILNDLNEVTARLVDSLYSLHFGPVTQNLFPLGERDLEFLGRFKYTKNGQEVQLFAKGIEKYRVGRKLIEEGYEPAAVKNMLEYATEFTHTPMVSPFTEMMAKFPMYYNWQPSNVKIKGKIPDLKFNY